MEDVFKFDFKPEKFNILVAEDDKDVARIIRFELENSGFNVRWAENGKIALEMIREKQPDCLILDVMMPVMDGFEVCKRIKSLNRTRNIPIIFLTARGATEDKVKGMGFDPDDYMTKPFDFKELLARINLHISKRDTKRGDVERVEEKIGKEFSMELYEKLSDPVDKLRQDLGLLMKMVHGNPALEEVVMRCEECRRGIRSVYVELIEEFDPFFDVEPEKDTVTV